jgi:hypothetical protein
MNLGHARLLEARLSTIAEPGNQLSGQGPFNKDGFTVISGNTLTGMVKRLNRSNWHKFLGAIPRMKSKRNRPELYLIA